ncbi:MULTISPECIES: hypothetical protein [Corynebacterium]|uniref:hypothetical protein n=1 Tax=Corynebacterium TaxID=1716 RepID=UPI0003B8FA88|nr:MULTISPECIES: hypothetical protein [Corynebacterium]ERS41854.1 hypothetical protein HMPREF1293_02005 [Corynebacterium sp. KPL1996]ERS44683.1 hypothetical protein HMPREF1287_01176 [Corynebacterium sp. KPL1986]ERS72608.1 hypothetical protein HMPREF1295_01535 [Corynebacterium sp. KPL1998]ERS73933.1 hypothetical protein HMPREF1300_00916 [Corynebacterium sp. KPL2004]MCT1410019.1 hypothetical protein [Corynebacterium accolens]
MSAKPSDLPAHSLAAAHEATVRHEVVLSALAKDAIYLMHLFTSRGFDYDTAIELTDITLGRFDHSKETE